MHDDSAPRPVTLPDARRPSQTEFGVAETDPHTHRLIRFDEEFCKLTGYSAEELEGVTLRDLTHPEDRSAPQLAPERISAGHGYMAERRLMRKDGGIVWARISYTHADSSTSQAASLATVQCWPLAQGVAGRRHALVFLASADPIVITTLDGAILDVNAAAVNAYGFAAAELVGKPLSSLHPESECLDVAAMLVSCARGETKEPVESVRVTAHGKCLISRVTYSLIRNEIGEPDAIATSAADLTERKRAEEALRRSDALSRALMENSTQAILVSDNRGRIIHANATAVQLFGYTREEFKGSLIEMLVPASVRTRHSSFRQQFYHGNMSRPMGEGMELRAVCKDGTEIDVEIGLSSVLMGRESFVAAFISDARLRRGHEAQIRKSRKELQDLTERLIEMQEEEKRYLARELHDDFSQRLAGLQMELTQLADSLDGEAEVLSPSRLQGRLQRVIQRISDLARDCHDLSRRLHSSVLEKVGLAAALRTEADEYFRRDSLRVKLDLAEGLHKLPAEAALCLYRITQEALRNVLVHSGVNEARIKIAQDDKELRMTISDSGLGFDPTGISQSRGLGLISMRERVRLLGGRFQIISAPGEGTSITVGVAWPTR